MNQINGIIPPMITPLTEEGSLDVDSLERLVEHILAGGVSGLFILGTTGEGPSLDYETRFALIEKTCQFVQGRVPVLVGVTDSSLRQAIKVSEHAAEAGAAAVVAAPPFYFTMAQEQVVSYFEALADQSPLPLMIYNIPSCAKNAIEFDTVRRCIDVKNIIGLKDSSGDLDFFKQVADEIRDLSDFQLFMGPEELLGKAVALGASGGVCGGANLFPDLYVQLYQAAASNKAASNKAASNEAEKVRRLSQAVDRVFDNIYRADDGSLKIIPGLKTALATTHVCQDSILPPLPALTANEQSRIQDSTMQLKEWLYGEVLEAARPHQPLKKSAR